MPLASQCPASRHLQRVARPLTIRRILGAFIKRHDDVCSQRSLHVYRFFWSEKVRRAIQMRTEFHALIAHLAQLAEAKNLEAAGIGEQGALPGHEAMQPA